MSRSRSHIFKRALSIVVVVVILFFVFYRLTEIPSSLFCDETEFALVSKQLIEGDYSNFYNPFYYKHFSYVLPTLVIYLKAPFIFVFGLTEFAVRFGSSFYTVLSIFIWYFIYKELGWKNKLMSLLILTLFPIFLHQMRLGFGMAETYAVWSLSIFFMIRMRKNPTYFRQMLVAFLVGFCFFGQTSSIFITIPVFVAFLFTSYLIEDISRKLSLKTILKRYVAFVATLLLVISPVFIQMKFYPGYFERLEQKNVQNIDLTLGEHFYRVSENIPKYFDPEYLFIKGEYEIPNAFISRHSLTGMGVLNPIIIALVLIGLVGLFLQNYEQKYFVVSMIALLFYPLPDLLTTKIDQAPYTYSATMILIVLPFIIGYSLNVINSLKSQSVKIALLGGIGIYMLFYGYLLFTKLEVYPMKSADYWGFQEGMKQLVEVSAEKQGMYDEILITDFFNSPQSLLSFYNDGEKCEICSIGGVTSHDPELKQLFFIRKAELEQIVEVMTDYQVRVVEEVPIANGEIEYLGFEITEKE